MLSLIIDILKFFLDFLIFPLARHVRFMIYYPLVRPERVWTSFFDNWQLEIKENYNS